METHNVSAASVFQRLAYSLAEAEALSGQAAPWLRTSRQQPGDPAAVFRKSSPAIQAADRRLSAKLERLHRGMGPKRSSAWSP